MDYHLPRLQSGDAFAFGEAWPEVRELVIADNQGAYGLITKLAEMGVSGMGASTQALVARLFGLAVVGFALLAGVRTRGAEREVRAVSWIALLGLASMVSTGAFGDYVPVAATWLMTLLAGRMTRLSAWALVPVWVFQFFIVGTSPLGEYFESGVMIPLSALGVVMLLGFYGWVMAGYRVRESEAAEGSDRVHRLETAAAWS